LLPRVTAPNYSRQHATPGHGDVFCTAPRRKAVMLARGHGESLLPPAVQAFAFIGADGEGAAPRFAAGFLALKLRANLLARRDGRPTVGRGRMNLEGERPGKSD